MFSDIYNITGPVGLLLLIFAVLACFTALYSFSYVLYSLLKFRGLIGNLENLPEKPEEIRISNEFCHITLLALRRLYAKKEINAENIRQETGFLFNIRLKGLFSSLTCLKVIAVISPLCGLLGTVLGMLDVFEALSVSTGVDAAMLSKGISEALITTVMGLVIAIPAILVFHLMNLWLKSVYGLILNGISLHIDRLAKNPELKAKQAKILDGLTFR